MTLSTLSTDSSLLQEVNYRKDRLEAVNRFFEDLNQRKVVDGYIYSLSRYGKVFAEQAGGRLCYEEESTEQMQTDTIFRIASITKLFTAAAIWQLSDDGKLHMGQPVCSLLKEFDAEPFRPITIAHLLTHTSGIAPDYGTVSDAYYQGAWFYIYQTGLGKENWISAGLSYGLRFPVGTQWMYSSFGYVLLGAIIEKVTGIRAEEYITEHIIKPLGMSDTSFDPQPEKAHRYAIRHERAKAMFQKLQSGELTVEDLHKDEEIRMPSTGGGMFSTVADLQKFGNMLLNDGKYEGGHILSRMAVQRMTKRFNTEKLPNYAWGAGGDDRAYGLGPDLRYNVSTSYTEGTFFHEGAGACALFMDPVEKVSAVWYVPFHNEVWDGIGIMGAHNVIWSGLE
ncbi:serine hydrolase domain-containing protein [Paenibacillus tengchongensis]|uniref:serine hydrolase domain-containing protein n=1 Tax=Paenibacillus tengchongensis TaxID=2608684 RepID=UPI0016528527|nr:serine hydrolase domain-containing protein [Paenibacillus tengchongensis]